MYIQSLEAVVQDGTVSFDVAEKYLSLYIGDSDWKEKIGQLWSVQKKKLKDDSLAKDFVKKSIACACLSPIINKVSIPDEKHVLIFWVSGWPQFNERDWFALFQDVIKKDIEIEKNRRKIFYLGIFDQIDMSPLTRQAYNWIYDRLEKESFESEDKKNEAIEKIKNLVKIYGGAIICNLFTNYSSNIDKILNWRSGYFIEREIYKVYSLDQIIKIKSAEINKTNKNYIKTIK
jgi:hypothetical protein